MRTILLISAAALALAACHKTSGAKSADATSATPAAPSGGATHFGLPTRKVGLWEQSFSQDGKANPMMTKIRMCIDAATDAKMSVLGEKMKSNDDCQRSVTHGLDGALTFTSTCKMGGGATTTSKGTASGDFSSSYKIHAESDVTGSAIAALNGHHVTEIDATYLGPCPAGMTGGDMTMSNGMTINVTKMMAAGAALGAHRP